MHHRVVVVALAGVELLELVLDVQRLLAGEADLQVVGAREGFDESLYPLLAMRPEVAAASPVLEIEARLPGRDDSLRILGLDLFRVMQVQPGLMPRVVATAGRDVDDAGGDGRLAALQPSNLFLSADARALLEQPLRAEFAQGKVQWQPDPAVAAGDCQVESAGTVIDGSMEKRWRRAVAALGLVGSWQEAQE